MPELVFADTSTTVYLINESWVWPFVALQFAEKLSPALWDKRGIDLDLIGRNLPRTATGFCRVTEVGESSHADRTPAGS